MTRTLTAIAAALLLAGCTVPSDPIPQDTVAGQPGTLEAPPAVSSCDQVREAFLTGTNAQRKKALKRLRDDKGADGTAREYAGYWLGRDKDDKDLQSMDQTLIVGYCGG